MAFYHLNLAIKLFPICVVPCAAAGRLEEADKIADRWVERADALGLMAGQLVNHQARAYVALLANDHEVSLDYTGEAEDLLKGTDEAVLPIWMSPIICLSLIAAGKLDETDQRLQTVLDATRKAGMSHWEGMALKVRGQLHQLRGNGERASTDFDAAIAIFEDLGSRIELGRTLVLRASLNDGDDAEEDRLKARTLFEACGAAGDLAALTSS